MPVLTVSDHAAFKPYASGQVYCHVLAFQVSTNSTLVDLLVTDYTSNTEIVNDRVRLPDLEGFKVIPNQCLQLKVPLKVLMELADAYQEQYGEEFFNRLEAHLSQTNWVVLHEKFCLANLQVGVQKKSTHLTGVVQLASLLGDLPELMPFFNRFLEGCTSLLAANPPRALKVITGLSMDARERGAVILGPLIADSTSYSSDSQTLIKAEHSFAEPSLEDIDLQVQLRALLEPVSQPAQLPRPSQTQTQYLTQLHTQPSEVQIYESQVCESQVYESQVYESQAYEEPQTSGPNSADSERGPSLFVPESWTPPPYCTLERLNDLPLVPDNMVYTTEAYVVGSMPSDLGYICTKVYEARRGRIDLSDPHLALFELVILDSIEKKLTPLNSLVVTVPSNEVMDFVGVQFSEQLYTRLEQFQEIFSRRPLHKVSMELSLVSEDGIVTWTARNLDFGKILGENN